MVIVSMLFDISVLSDYFLMQVYACINVVHSCLFFHYWNTKCDWLKECLHGRYIRENYYGM